jgi:hypothetical protein
VRKLLKTKERLEVGLQNGAKQEGFGFKDVTPQFSQEWQTKDLRYTELGRVRKLLKTKGRLETRKERGGE